MRPRNRHIIERAMITVTDLQDDGGYLNPEQASTFIKMLCDTPTILGKMRTVTMGAPQMKINKLGFGSRILRAAPAAGSGGLSASDYAVPITDHVDLETKEIICELRIPYDVLEDNIELERFEDSVMELITQHTAIDLEELIIRGDEDSLDEYLALHDGLLVLADQHPLVYAEPPESLDRTIFKLGLEQMPVKYLRNKAVMDFFVSHYVETEFNDTLAGRETSLGDTRIVNDYSGVLKAYGVPISACAMMPDTNYLFSDPKNFILGIQRKIQIETDKDISDRVIIIVLTMRAAIAIEEVDAVVKATGLVAAETTTAA